MRKHAKEDGGGPTPHVEMSAIGDAANVNEFRFALLRLTFLRVRGRVGFDVRL